MPTAGLGIRYRILEFSLGKASHNSAKSSAIVRASNLAPFYRLCRQGSLESSGQRPLYWSAAGRSSHRVPPASLPPHFLLISMHCRITAGFRSEETEEVEEEATCKAYAALATSLLC